MALSSDKQEHKVPPQPNVLTVYSEEFRKSTSDCADLNALWMISRVNMINENTKHTQIVIGT